MSEDPYRPPEHVDASRDVELPQRSWFPIVWRMRALTGVLVVVGFLLPLGLYLGFGRVRFGSFLLFTVMAVVHLGRLVYVRVLARRALAGDAVTHSAGALEVDVPEVWTVSLAEDEDGAAELSLAAAGAVVEAFFLPGETVQPGMLRSWLGEFPARQKLYDGEERTFSVAGVELEGASVVVIEDLTFSTALAGWGQARGGLLYVRCARPFWVPRAMLDRVLAGIRLREPTPGD